MSRENKKSDPHITDGKMPLDLKGSEQHHDLKNKSGKKGDPDHTVPAAKSEGEPID